MTEGRAALTQQERDIAVRRAAAVCFHFAEATRKRDKRGIQLITDGLSREELVALCMLYAEALPDFTRLKVIKDALA